MRRAIGAGPLVVLLLVMASSPAIAYQRPGRTERVNVASDGTEASGDITFFALPAISADGRFVAFDSYAANLVPDDTNKTYDVFVRDRVAGATERVSVGPGGAQADGSSEWASISADGRFVAFQSSAPNLVAGGTGLQIYVRDRLTGTTELASVADDGTPGNLASYGSYGPAISADGRYVVFASYATNLATGDTNDDYDVFIRDRVAHTTQRVSTTTAGQSGGGGSLFPTISADGSTVAFTTLADDLVPPDTNLTFDNLAWDRATHAIERVSAASDGGEANNASASTPVLSGDGRYVAFQSYATNLVPADSNNTTDIFVRDRVAKTTERVSVAGDGAEASQDYFGPQAPAISADGRFVAFSSPSTNLVSGDTNGAYDAFVHDRLSGATERVSLTTAGGQGTGSSMYTPSLSADGRYVAFYSQAANLVPGDTNGRQDLFVRDRGPAAGTGGVTASAAGTAVGVSGWATFTGTAIASANDPANDAAPGAAAAGGELTGASVVYRPEDGDLMVRLRVASLPGVRGPGTGGASIVACITTGCPPGVAGAPAVLYGLEIALAGTRYEVRALRAAATGVPPAAPYFALYRCAPSCVEIARLTGGYGTTGDEIIVSVPLSALGAAEGSSLSALRVFTALGEAASGAVSQLDEVALGQTAIPTRSVTLGIAPAGTPEAAVVFDTPATLANGSFSGTLPTPPPGTHDVWARACLGTACGSASTRITIP